jgi:type I restriction enzyme S subunit
MNLIRLLKHYERIADAPDAVVRLRRFILALAVRGTLVPQDPTDKPVSVLLKLIAAEKARLVKLGAVRKPRDLDDGCTPDEPFAIPPTWKWARLDTAGAIVGGGTPPSTNTDNFAEPGSGTPWLTPADLGRNSKLYVSRGARDLSEKGLRSSSATLMPAGTVLFTSRAPIGYVAIADNPIATNQGFKSIIPYVSECSRFIAMVMKVLAPDIDSKASGTTFKEVSGKVVAAVSFPLPPLAEQHRIVAKVDEFMVLCDQLQAARARREATRDRLTAASLARLSQSDPDPAIRASHARSALDCFKALTVRPDQIKYLRQIVLNRAIRGKLALQDSNDEPAGELLTRIAAEKARLVKSGQVKKQETVAVVHAAEIPFDLPAGWAPTRLAAITVCLDFRRRPINGAEREQRIAGKLESELFPYFGATQQQGWIDDFLFDEELMLLGEDGAPFFDPFRAKAYLVSGKSWVNNHAHVFRGIHTSLPFLVQYLNIFDYSGRVVGATRPKLNQSQAIDIPIMLPPLAEQHRIVRKIDELMSLCDRLEASLAARQEIVQQLLDALIAEALMSVREVGLTRLRSPLPECPV